jgi:cysteine desulfurase
MFGFKIAEVASKTGLNAKSEGRPIYLDMAATTPMDPRVLDKMLPFFTEQYGNPHSRTHAYGWEAESAVDEARQHIADLVGAGSKDIVFTSGATESNNMIIKGIAKFHQGKRKHIITTQTVCPPIIRRMKVLINRNTSVCSILADTSPTWVSKLPTSQSRRTV